MPLPLQTLRYEVNPATRSALGCLVSRWWVSICGSAGTFGALSRDTRYYPMYRRALSERLRYKAGSCVDCIENDKPQA